MKYILAISGGVDSVVLLDKVINQNVIQFVPNTSSELDPRIHDIIIAHLDHGIRKESKHDADFVRNLAKKYNLPFVLGKAKLGKNASEKTARKVRYDFLRSISTGKESKKIVTAHHQDDLVETIVMNILRGTGWRGLTPFWSDDILRPLMNMSKAEIVRYAIEHNLDWVEDETNYDFRYFRNRIRFSLNYTSQEQKNNLIKLHGRQKQIRIEVEGTLQNIPSYTSVVSGSDPLRSSVGRRVVSGSDPLTIDPGSFRNLDDDIGIEVLNKITNGRLTNPQLKRLLSFIHTARSGDICQPGGGLQVSLYQDNASISELVTL